MLQVVQEYERAVIFRLGRLVSGGAKGPGQSENINTYFIRKKKRKKIVLWNLSKPNLIETNFCVENKQVYMV